MNLPVGSLDEVGATENSGIGCYASRGIYLFCVLASAIGRNVYFVLAAWAATDVSKSASALAILLALGSAAELLTSNVGGVLVDRFDRRFVCIACDLSRLILIFSTGIGLSFGDPLGVLCLSWTIFAFIDRTYSTALQPSFQTSFVLRTSLHSIRRLILRCLFRPITVGAAGTARPDSRLLVLDRICRQRAFVGWICCRRHSSFTH